MTKLTTAIAGLLFGTIAYAQNQGRVGINTYAPNASIDINPIESDNAKGILIPRLTIDIVKTITPNLSDKQNSMMAFFMESMPVSDRVGNYSLVTDAGYYYWEWNGEIANSRWVRIAEKRKEDLRAVGDNNHITIDAGNGGNGTNAGSGNNNIGIGKGALNSISKGNGNIALGLNTLGKTTDNSGLIAIGQNALRDNTGANNIAIGSHAMLSNTVGSGNISIGANALKDNIKGPNNVAIGTNSLSSNKEGQNNVAIGITALNKNTANNNIGIGPNSLANNEKGENNLAIGPDALKENKEGKENIALGFEALRNNNNSRNIAIGRSSLLSNTSGKDNISLGMNSLQGNQIGSQNIALGSRALEKFNGDRNIAIGYEALRSPSSGNTLNKNGNIGIGYRSLYHVDGDSNIGIGHLAGSFLTEKNNGNIHIGNADYAEVTPNAYNQTIANTIIIGHRITKPEIDAEDSLPKNQTMPAFTPNTILLGNDSKTDSPKVGIGTYQPAEKLDVVGAIKIGNTDTLCVKDPNIRYVEGVIRFNPKNKKFEGCTGTEWVPLH